MQNILNFRDVGRTVNRHAGQHLLRSGLLFRSGTPDDASPADRDVLATQHKITTIIDLRTDSEHVDHAQKYARSFSPSSAIDSSIESNLPRIPGIQYKMINLNGRAYSTALIRQLSYWNIARLVTLYALGWRNDAIAVLGQSVMADRGLIGLAQDSLFYSTAEVKQLFDVLGDQDNYPVLVHCTQGKDRTGLVVLLVLLLLDVPLVNIRDDYTRSQDELASERDTRLEQIHSIGLPSEFADCAPGWVEAVKAWLDENHNGVQQYLHTCGVSEMQQSRIRSILKG